MLSGSQHSSQYSGGAESHDQPLDLTADDDKPAPAVAAAPAFGIATKPAESAAGAAPAAAAAAAAPATAVAQQLAEHDEMALAGFHLLRVRGLGPANR